MLRKLPSVLRIVRTAGPAVFGGVITLYAWCTPGTATGYVGSSMTDGAATDPNRMPVTCGRSPDWLCTVATTVSPPIVLPLPGSITWSLGGGPGSLYVN